jgi:hypothetical protein
MMKKPIYKQPSTWIGLTLVFIGTYLIVIGKSEAGAPLITVGGGLIGYGNGVA